MSTQKMDKQLLVDLEPINMLTPTRISELAELCWLEKISRDLDPFRVHGYRDQSVYLISGKLDLSHPDKSVTTIVAGSKEAKRPIGKSGNTFNSAKAQTDIELLRVDDELLDIMMTWDQLASYQDNNKKTESPAAAKTPDPKPTSSWMMESGMFSVSNLVSGAFSQLPSANIEELFKRIKTVSCKKGEVVIREGDEGDFYYVIESGKAEVTRIVGGTIMNLAELKKGDAFGEEALVSGAQRNATVTMKTDGMLLRLDKKDFLELLNEPLLNKLSVEQAQRKVKDGAQWLDVRYPSEYQYNKLPGALNVPLNEIRNAIGVLDKNKEYIAYCHSGRRSSAAAFILAQRGYRIYMMEGGLRNFIAQADAS
jgi:rhodanese-related sulfurtransferase